jgi:hypothetical protein
MTRRDARARIAEALDRLGPDEQLVVALVAERLVMGRTAYGPLRVQRDRRDFTHEALEEAADACAYTAAALVRAQRSGEGAPRG